MIVELPRLIVFLESVRGITLLFQYQQSWIPLGQAPVLVIVPGSLQPQTNRANVER